MAHAYEVIRDLMKRHTNDLFFTEVKNGSTYFQNHSRIDAMAVAKSWVHPMITGYEVKVSRSDYLRDSKWMAYLDMCHEFYFVAPAGVVQEPEIPDGVGLKVWYPSGTFKTVRKAKYRNIPLPTDTLMYLLMQYAVSSTDATPRDNTEALLMWLEDKASSRILADRVKTKLFQRVSELEEKASSGIYELNRAKEITEENKEIRKLLEEAGLSGGYWGINSSIRQLIARANANENAGDVAKKLRDLATEIESGTPKKQQEAAT